MGIEDWGWEAYLGEEEEEVEVEVEEEAYVGGEEGEEEYSSEVA
jgi:hypothetical protein